MPKAQAKAGPTADASATFAEALRIAQALPDKNVAAEVLLAIAARLPD